jgi:hypothetical protein
MSGCIINADFGSLFWRGYWLLFVGMHDPAGRAKRPTAHQLLIFCHEAIMGSPVHVLRPGRELVAVHGAASPAERRREKLEAQAKGTLDGRYLERADRTRDVQIGLKTSEDKKKQFDKLRLLTRLTYTQIFEQALDVFEAEWKRRCTSIQLKDERLCKWTITTPTSGWQ